MPPSFRSLEIANRTRERTPFADRDGANQPRTNGAPEVSLSPSYGNPGLNPTRQHITREVLLVDVERQAPLITHEPGHRCVAFTIAPECS